MREVREGAGKSLEECLEMEFCMVHHCCTGKTDFTEGVKALLIEKRGQAKWNPASIEQVRPSWFIAAHHWGLSTLSQTLIRVSVTLG